MLRVDQLKLDIRHTPEDLEKKLCRTLRIRPDELLACRIVRRSLDARKKDAICYSYTVDAQVRNEDRVRCPQARPVTERAYRLPENGGEVLKDRPVVVGAGPAGIFAAYSLARAGLCPLVLERGEEAEKRKKTVERFWESGRLDPESNVSFGEGGAGTFSDGKLNTLVKDDSGRNTEVLRTFVRFGADPGILWQHLPHIGTDRLIGVITAMRREIERLGGSVRFGAKMTDLVPEGGRLKGITLASGEFIPCEVLVLAVGHSARDTFALLKERGLRMEAKAFAVGLRIQHPQRMIDLSQFGEKEAEFLSPAAYKLTAQASDGRGVYTFCMCPGGYVVNASTEEGALAVNGMSYHKRNSPSANSALIVQVRPEDFGSEDVLAGVAFQRRLERLAFLSAEGSIPVQLSGDFMAGRAGRVYGDVEPCFRGAAAFARLDTLLPDYVTAALRETIPAFGRRLRGFDRPDAVLAGVESRTSSPVRILRGENLMSDTEGVYPCGEGAGYAGGITSAAMDGLKTAEAIIKRFRRLEQNG